MPAPDKPKSILEQVKQLADVCGEFARAVGNLRHMYKQTNLNRELADGLLAPQIVRLENVLTNLPAIHAELVRLYEIERASRSFMEVDELPPKGVGGELAYIPSVYWTQSDVEEFGRRYVALDAALKLETPNGA